MYKGVCAYFSLYLCVCVGIYVVYVKDRSYEIGYDMI